MAVFVHAEITADAGQLILMASGPDHEVAYAAKRIGTLTPLITKSDPPGALTLPLTWPAVLQLANTFGTHWRPGPGLQAWTVAELTRRTTALPTELEQPAVGMLRPRPYQIEGAAMIARLGRVLILDEPGTGKTITAILGMVERLAAIAAVNRDDDPVLTVCPASVVDSWVEAWQTWAPQLRTIAWRGRNRRQLIGSANVYVVSYDTATRDTTNTNPRQSALVALDAGHLIVDEFHKVKNPDASRTQAVRRLGRNVDTFIGLSGTPITHHPLNLWPTLTLLAPGAWPASERWKERYCEMTPADYGEQGILGLSPYTEPEYRNAVLGQVRRVAKADVLTQLPPKVYSVRTVELPPAYRKAYDDMEELMLAQLPEDSGELSVMSVLAQLTRLSQLACAAADVKVTEELGADGEMHEHTHVTLKAPSWKVDALLEILAERPEQQVLVFAPSRQLIMLAAAAVPARVGYIVGGQTPKERTANVAAFQAGELQVLCATTGAGGVGITLTAASTVVFLQRPWSLVDSLQAEDRAHRIGSERHESIEIIDVIARDTLDTRIRSVLRERAGQLSDLVQDPRIVAELLGGASVRELRKTPVAHAAGPVILRGAVGEPLAYLPGVDTSPPEPAHAARIVQRIREGQA